MNTAVHRWVGNPGTSEDSGLSSGQQVKRYDEISLKMALIRACDQSGGKLQTVIEILSNVCDWKAATSNDASAIPYACGFRTVQRALSQIDKFSPETSETLGQFLASWMRALVNSRTAMDAPDIAADEGCDGVTLRLTWKRNKKTFRVRILGNSINYTANFIDGTGALHHQEGELNLEQDYMLNTIAWLVEAA